MPPQSELSDPHQPILRFIFFHRPNPHDPSIFTDYNWRVYKDPCGSDHYLIIMENSTIKKFRTTNTPPHQMEFRKSKLEILQKKLCLTTLIPESNTNQEEPIIHFSNTLITTANKTIPQTTISQGSQKSAKT